MCRELHIAYRYGDHYDSVRRIGDNSESPAQLRIEVYYNMQTPYIRWNYVVTSSPACFRSQSSIKTHIMLPCWDVLYWCISEDFLPLLLSEHAEFTRPATWVRGRSEGQTEKPFPHRLGGRQRDPELHQKSRNPGSEVPLDSLAAGRISQWGQKSNS